MRLAHRLLQTCLLASFMIFPLVAQSETDKPHKSDTTCVQPARWYQPDGPVALQGQDVIERAAKSPVVLLGEHHTEATHHRWQLQIITQLYTLNQNMILGFEMFPRRFQPVLDAWIRGELSEQEFLEQTDWDNVWKYDADMYLPLFHFARMNKLPMIALNVDLDLIGDIARNGWDSLSEEDREGVLTPAPAQPAYRESLNTVFRMHTHIKDDLKQDDPASKERFERFVQAQLTWDGAMAQKIAETYKRGGAPVVVGVMGSGHIENGHGVPHQLQSLGLDSVSLLPWTIGMDCTEMKQGLADAVFVLEADDTIPEGFRPLLGVRIDSAGNQGGVLIEQVIEESVGEDAGLQPEDVILRAAGLEVNTPQELIEIVKRQAPGTWLPLEILRNGSNREMIAKFPPYP